ncbi:YfiR family protein [bacterium]|nr:YfiR family protein [bacterium]
MKRLLHILVLTVMILLPNVIVSQEIKLPVELQYILVQKILTFERNLRSNTNATLNIAIIYQSNYRTSLNIMNEFVEQNKIHQLKVQGRPIRIIPLELDNFAEMEKELNRQKVEIAYIAPLRAVNVETIIAVLNSNNILSMSGVQTYIDQNVSVTFSEKGGKPEIIINIGVCKLIGADFSSQLLKMVTVKG